MRYGGEVRPKKSANVNSPKTGAVVLSRFSSSRLPGKALMRIAGKPILAYIVERLSMVLPPEQIVIATSEEPSDDPIAAFCQESGIACYRGSLENVAVRFVSAAEAMNWDYAMRINGDNVFVDIPALRDMVALASAGDYDFISNVKNRTFPKGMSIEIVRTSVFRSLVPKILNSDAYREHVTLYLYEHEDEIHHHYFLNTELPEAAGLQFALDTAEDFERTSQIMAHMKTAHTDYNLKEIYALFLELPS